MYAAALVIMALCAVLAKTFQYLGFRIHDLDTGVYSNLVYNITYKGEYYAAVSDLHHLGDHFSPIILFFVPFYQFAPSALWLLVFQGLAVGVTYGLCFWLGLILFRAAQWKLAAPAALGFAVMLFFYRPFTSGPAV